MTIPYVPAHSPWVDSAGQQVNATVLNAYETALLALLGVAPTTNGAMVWDGTKFRADAKIVNANVDASAAIARSKLDFGSGLVNADIAAAAGIVKSKLASLGIVDADVSAAAAITLSKLAGYLSGAAIYRKATIKTVNTTVAATDLLNGEITLAALNASSFVRLTAFGDWKNNSGGSIAPPRLQLILGGTTLLDTGTSGNTTDLATRYGWKVSAEIDNLGATNSQASSLMYHGGVTMGGFIQNAFTTGEGNFSQGQSVAGTEMFMALGANPGTAVDTSTAKTLVLNVINGSASALYETRLLGALIEVI